MYPPDYSERERDILEAALNDLEPTTMVQGQRVDAAERSLLLSKIRSHQGLWLLAVPADVKDDIRTWGTGWLMVSYYDEADAISVRTVSPPLVMVKLPSEEVAPGWQQRLLDHLNERHPGWEWITNGEPTPMDHEALHNEQCDHTHGAGAFRDPALNVEPAIHSAALTYKEEQELPFDAVVCDARGMVYRLVPRTERGKLGSQKRWLRDGQDHLFTHPARPLIRLDRG